MPNFGNNVHQPAMVFHDVRNVDDLLAIMRDHHWATPADA
jgi:hypothetical protein